MNLPTILYVEDNAGDVLLLHQAFEERCFNVQMQVIADGEQALRYLQVKSTARDAPPPDIILLDARLPKVDGGDLLKFIETDDYLHGIPAYIFDKRSARQSKGPPDDRRLEKPTTWDGYLELADRFIKAIQKHRSKKTSKSVDTP